MDHQIDDVEAVPPLPDESDACSSSAIDNEQQQQPQPQSFFGRRKRAVVAVVSIVLVAAVGAGVALAVKPKKSTTSPDQAGSIISQNNQDNIIIAYDGEPITKTETDGEEGDESSIPWEDEALPATLVDGELSQGEQEEEEEQATSPIVDDEELDIIIDAGYEHEPDYPEDILYDTGYEQQYPDDEADLLPDEDDIDVTGKKEKVPFNSEDMAIELANFEGTFTDFVVTPDLSRISVSSNNKCANPGEGLWQMSFNTDKYPWENEWRMRDSNGEVIMSGPPEGRNYDRLTKYVGAMCIEEGTYTIELDDKPGDGICCEFGTGEMVVRVNGKTVARTGNTPFTTFKRDFVITSLNDGAGSTATTPNPTPEPTPNPTKRPNPAPGLNPANLHEVTVKMLTDKFAPETGYQFVGPNGEVLVQYKQGTLEKETLYEDTVLVPTGEYKLQVQDRFQGLEGDGYFSVEVDGEEVMYDNSWDTRVSQTKSYTINPGFEPNLTTAERQWLEGHNQRREEYHAAEGTPFNRLVWSRELADQASNWIDEITPTCKMVREPGLVAGENVAARSSSGPRDEGPGTILARWADNKRDLGYPENQSWTQIVWRASRYVGCANKEVESGGRYCYVSICRYARAGNCAMGQFDGWEAPTLADRSRCGPTCPDDECY